MTPEFEKLSANERGEWLTNLRRRSIAISLIAELRAAGVALFKLEGFPVRAMVGRHSHLSDFHRELCAEFQPELQDAIGLLRHSDLNVLCQSPIETVFFGAAIQRLPEIEPQVECGPYRIDFAVRSRMLAIELDGQEFHSSPEQRTSDAKRERYLMLHGWTVVRFTGREVHADVQACVTDAVNILSTLEATDGADTSR